MGTRLAEIEENRKYSDEGCAEYLNSVAGYIERGKPIPDEIGGNLAGAFRRAAKSVAKGKASHAKAFLCEQLGIYERERPKKTQKMNKLASLYIRHHRAFGFPIPILPEFDSDSTEEAWDRMSKAEIYRSLSDYSGYSSKQIERILKRWGGHIRDVRTEIRAFTRFCDGADELNESEDRYTGGDMLAVFPDGLPEEPTLEGVRKVVCHAHARQRMERISYDFGAHKAEEIVHAVFEVFPEIDTKDIVAVVDHLKTQDGAG